MYNRSLKRKWDNKNVLDYAVETADQKAREEERANAEREKKEMAFEMARKMLAASESTEKIINYTGLTIDEVEALV